MLQKISRVNTDSIGSSTQSSDKQIDSNGNRIILNYQREQRNSIDSVSHEEGRRMFREEKRNGFNYAEPDKETKKTSSSVMMSSKSKSPSRVRRSKSSSDWSSPRDEQPRDWWSLLDRVTSRAGVTLTRVEERCER